MKIAATVDLHGNLPEVPECDVLVIAGDIGPAKNWYHRGKSEAIEWLNGPLTKWLKSVPAKYIIAVAGNHDFIAQRKPQKMRSLPWIYLCDESSMINGVKFYGSPWTPELMDWAFNETERQLANRWRKIPLDTDVLITHGPPFKLGDRNRSGEYCGSTSLKAWRETTNVLPQLHLFGHIHECAGQSGYGWANVSFVDEHYQR